MNQMYEEWRPVIGYEGLYEVSSLGQVRSLPKRTVSDVRLLTAYAHPKTRYLSVTLSKAGKARSCYVHRLVLQAFLPNPNNYPQSNHINGNKADNRLENLEWCSPRENLMHAFGMGLNHAQKGSSSNFAKLTDEDVLTIRREFAAGVHRRILAERFNIKPSTVNEIARRRRWKHI